MRRVILALLLAAFPLSRSPSQPAASRRDEVLARFGGGAVTAEDLYLRWKIQRIPDPVILDTLLAARQTAQMASPSPAVADVEAQLIDEARQVALDKICLLLAEREGWAGDLALTHRAKSAVVRANFQDFLAHFVETFPEPSGEDLATLWVQQRQILSRPERRSARVIVLPATAASAEQQRALAGELRARIGAGEDFGALAREFSCGPGRARGGLVERISRAEAPWPELGEAIFQASPEGALSLFEGDIAFYLTQVTAVEPAVEPSPEQVRAAAVAAWRQALANRSSLDQLERWAGEIGVEIHEEAPGDGDPVASIGDQTFAA